MMNTKIQKITEADQECFVNMFNYYLYELSAYSLEDIGTNGTFEMDDTSPYYQDERLHPYFIKVNENLVGFILITSPPYVAEGVDYSVQELFILPKYRGMKIAKEAAMRIFRLFPGRYDVGMFKSNAKAVKFWTNLLSSLNIAADVKEGVVEIAGNTLSTMALTFVIQSEVDSHD